MRDDIICRQFAIMKRVTGLILLLLVGFVPPDRAASIPSRDGRAGVSPKIVGGKPVTISEFPYQAAVVSNPHNPTDLTEEFVCAGTIVGGRWILTCASSVALKSPSNLVVAVGLTSLAAPEAGQFFPVDQIIAHPNYGLPTNNLALLHLAAPIDFAAAYVAAPVELLSPSDESAGLDGHGVMARIAGWGTLGLLL
jgi:secreted trypsin-like serine protease